MKDCFYVKGNVSWATGAMFPPVSGLGIDNHIIQAMNELEVNQEILGIVHQAATEAVPGVILEAFMWAATLPLRNVGKSYMDLLVESHGASTSKAVFKSVDDVNYLAITRLSSYYPGCIDQPDDRGVTPLIYAVQSNQYEVVRTLISLGADLEARSLQGRAIELAHSLNKVGLVSMLEKAHQIDAEPLSPEVKLFFKAILFDGKPQAWKDSNQYNAAREKATALCDAVVSYDQNLQDFIRINSRYIKEGLSHDCREWGLGSMSSLEILTNLALHYGRKISGLVYLEGSSKNVMKHFIDSLPRVEELSMCSVAGLALRVLARDPAEAMKVSGNTWLEITKFLVPNDIISRIEQITFAGEGDFMEDDQG